MFPNQQDINESNKVRETYNALVEKGKELGLVEAAQNYNVLYFLRYALAVPSSLYEAGAFTFSRSVSSPRFLRCNKSQVRSSAQEQIRSNVYCQISGLEDVIFNDFIKDDLIPSGDGQVASGSASLPDPVALETEEEKLEREQNECDALDAVGDYIV
jgi:hypothetical protein